MIRPVDLWQHCPVCKARLRDSPECYRCGMDFSPILHVADHADALAEEVRAGLKAGPGEEAFWEALHALRLHVCEETLRSFALAALAQRRFPLALALWKELNERRKG